MNKNSQDQIDNNGHQDDDGSNNWSVRVSSKALATVNPIRKTTESLRLELNKDLPLIPLSIGDPTLSEKFMPCQEIIDAMKKSLCSFKFNGYQPAAGNLNARHAIADYCCAYGMNVKFSDVIITSGCGHALDIAMSIFAIPNGNILAPRPGFPLYKTLSTMLDIEIRFYNLLPDQEWQIDLDDMNSKIDSNTAAIIYNNPANPCGSVFSRDHIMDFLAVAEKHRVPVIADEIYEDLVFVGHRFYALGSLSKEVPILHCSGTTKKFLIPGWRLGWLVVNDIKGRFGEDVRSALTAVSQRVIGSNSIVQGALPEIFKNTPKSFFDNTIAYMMKNANLAYNRLQTINGLTPIKSNGTFYIMVRIEFQRFPEFNNDNQFVERLVSEQSVFCLPGGCFEYPGYIRMVLAISYESLREAFDRIERFCIKYYVK